MSELAILESEEVERRLDAECRKMAERIWQLREWLVEQPYINAGFDAGRLSAAQSLLEGFVTPRHRRADERRRDQARLLAAVEGIRNG